MTQPLDPDVARRLAEAGYLNMPVDNQLPTAPVDNQLPTAPVDNQLPTAPVDNFPPAETQKPVQVIDQKKLAADFQKQKLMKQAETMKALGVSEQDIDNKIGAQIRDIDQKLVLTTDLDDMGNPLAAPSQMPEVAPQDMIANTALTAGYDLMQQGVAQAGQAGMAKAAEDAAYSQKISADLQKMNEANEQERLANQEKIMAEQAKLDSEVQRVSNLKVDPGRFWSDRSTADKILIGASLFLGAFGAARTGVNQASAVINNAIERDLNLQQADIAQQTTGLEKKRGILEQMRATFKNDMLARNAAKIAYLQDAENKIRGIAAKYQGQEAQGKAMQLIGQIEMQKQAATAQFMQKYQSMQPISADANPSMLTEDQRERFVPGYGLALSKEDATEAKRNILPVYKTVEENLNELIKLSETGSSVNLADRDRANVIKQVLVGQLRLPILGPGTVQQFERDLLNDLIADPVSIFSINARQKNKLIDLKNTLLKERENKMDSLGFTSPQRRAEQSIGFTPLK